MRECLLEHLIDRRLGKNRSECLFIYILRNIFNIVADQYTNARYLCNVKVALDLLAKLSRLDCIFRFLLNKHALYAHSLSSWKTALSDGCYFS